MITFVLSNNFVKGLDGTTFEESPTSSVEWRRERFGTKPETLSDVGLKNDVRHVKLYFRVVYEKKLPHVLGRTKDRLLWYYRRPLKVFKQSVLEGVFRSSTEKFHEKSISGDVCTAHEEKCGLKKSLRYLSRWPLRCELFLNYSDKSTNSQCSGL